MDMEWPAPGWEMRYADREPVVVRRVDTTPSETLLRLASEALRANPDAESEQIQKEVLTAVSQGAI